MKILLTGASGLLGSALMAEAARRGEHAEALARPVLGADPHALAARLDGCALLIHAAANTDVEQCERDPDQCYRDNFLLTELMAQACRLAGVKLLFISSTGVYGTGSDQAYREFSPVLPTTHHHRSKVMAEDAVLRAAAGNLVVRTGWLFGGAAAAPKNFVARRLDEARRALAAGQPMYSNTEQRGVPCSTTDVAARLLAMGRADLAGVFNCVNGGSASRFDYVQAIVESAGLAVPVLPALAASFNRLAHVSPNEMAVNWKLDALGWEALPDWRASLHHYITEGLASPTAKHAH